MQAWGGCIYPYVRRGGCAILVLSQKVSKTEAICKKVQAQTGGFHGFYQSD